MLILCPDYKSPRPELFAAKVYKMKVLVQTRSGHVLKQKTRENSMATLFRALEIKVPLNTWNQARRG